MAKVIHSGDKMSRQKIGKNVMMLRGNTIEDDIDTFYLIRIFSLVLLEAFRAQTRRFFYNFKSLLLLNYISHMGF